MNRIVIVIRQLWAIAAVAIAIAFTGLASLTPLVARADAADASIEVLASDPCTVELSGVSDNVTGYRQLASVTDGRHAFPVSADEPGEYRYELRQVETDGFPVYDETVYVVYVSAYYDQGVMQVIVTGGISGSEDKPEGFVFTKPGNLAPGVDPDTEWLTITYDLNGGVYDGKSDNIAERYRYGTVISIHDAPSREGYAFLYWKGSEHHPGDRYTVVEDHVFAAQWEPNQETGQLGVSSEPDVSKQPVQGENPISTVIRDALLQTGSLDGTVLWIVIGVLGAVSLAISLVAKKASGTGNDRG